MQYKTIVHQLLEDRPQLHKLLRRHRLLMAAIELYASELKTDHESWKQHLRVARPESQESQIVSEAFELALRDLQDRLPDESRPNDSEAPSTEQVVIHIRNHLPVK